MKQQLLLKLIEMLIDSKEPIEKSSNGILNELVGKHVLVRHHLMGVNFGLLDSCDEFGFILKDSRKLWRWQAESGIALESVAFYGVKDGTRATAKSAKIYIPMTELCGVIEVSNARVVDQINDYPVSKQG